MTLVKGDVVTFTWGKKTMTGTFLRKNGAYHYFQVGDDKDNVVELYVGEWKKK